MKELTKLIYEHIVDGGVQKVDLVAKFGEEDLVPSVSIYSIWKGDEERFLLEDLKLKIAQVFSVLLNLERFQKALIEEIYIVEKWKNGQQNDFLCDIKQLDGLRERVLERLKKEEESEESEEHVCAGCGKEYCE